LNAAAVAVALGAAVAFGASTALMHHSASRAPLHARGIVALLRHLLAQPRWLLGMCASLVGLGLHALALRLGSLAVVQPVVVTGLVFAFVFRAVLDRTRLSHKLMGWVLLTACGIAVFLFGARSTNSSGDPSGRRAILCLMVGIAVAALAWALASRVRPNHAGLLLGISGGIVFGLIAGVLKAVTGSANLLDLFTTWPVYVLGCLGATGFIINQRAYSSAPLSSSLPMLCVVNPLIAVAFGVLVFHERPSRQLSQLLIELLGLVVVLAGVSFLARIEDQARDDATPDDPSPDDPAPDDPGPDDGSPTADDPFPSPRPAPRGTASRTP
jgi:drug/metabolite transporter (DMT)-like permease